MSFRSLLPLRVSSGFTPDSLLREVPFNISHQLGRNGIHRMVTCLYQIELTYKYPVLLVNKHGKNWTTTGD